MISHAQAQTIAAARKRLENPDPWLTVGEIAAQLDVAKMTIYRAVDGGYLQSVRIGRGIRIRTSWFERWINNGGRTFEGEIQ